MISGTFMAVSLNSGILFVDILMTRVVLFRVESTPKGSWSVPVPRRASAHAGTLKAQA